MLHGRIDVKNFLRGCFDRDFKNRIFTIYAVFHYQAPPEGQQKKESPRTGESSEAILKV